MAAPFVPDRPLDEALTSAGCSSRPRRGRGTQSPGGAVTEHHNATLIRKGYAAFSAGDVETLKELIA
jgi:hypothetical protein